VKILQKVSGGGYFFDTLYMLQICGYEWRMQNRQSG